MTSPTTLVIVCTLNEKLVIDEVMQGILDLKDPALNVLLVDDDSLDQTWRNYGTNWAAKYAEFYLLRRPVRQKGQGHAWRAGLNWCFEAETHYDRVITMAGNTTDDPAHIPALLAKLDAGADVVVAERSADPGGDDGQPRRKWGFTNTAVGATTVDDVESNYRAYTRAALDAIKPLTTKSVDHRIKTELLARCAAKKLRIDSIPVPFRERSDKSDALGGNTSGGGAMGLWLKRMVGRA